MLENAVSSQVPFGWVTGDSIYGGDRRLRLWLEDQHLAFVLAIARDEPLWYGFRQQRADALAAAIPADAWQRLSCGESVSV